MDTQPERVYVGIGTDWDDGFSTLTWTLRKWAHHGISVVILHAPHGICRDYVYTPLCKLPASSVNQETLRVLDNAEEAKREKILSQYIAFCGRVKAEVIKLEKTEQPLHKQIVDAISGFRITNLVMSFTFVKSSSCGSRTAISGSFYVLRHKPDFCNMFVLWGGRLVFPREEINEGLLFPELEGRNHNWLGKTFPETDSSRSHLSPHQWEKLSQEIERYENELLSSHPEEEQIIEVDKQTMRENFKELHMPEYMVLKCRIKNAQDTTHWNRKQTIAAKERIDKAKRAASICNTRDVELEACINDEVVKRVYLNSELGRRREEIHELQSELEEKRSKLNSILEIQKELSRKLRLSSSAKALAEVQLEKEVRSRADMVHAIEELRKHRDVLQRRIEFCREKDAIGKASKLSGFGFDFRQFSAAEIVAATEDFSECLRLKSAGQWTNVYRGRINHLTVAVKIYNPANAIAPEAFTTKVKLLNHQRHPNVLAMIGICPELNFIVFEYMHNGSLHDALLSHERGCKRKNVHLNWHGRIRIAAETCSALGFLHKAKPKPIVHGNLEPSKILLDQNNAARISGLKGSYDKPDIKLDIRAFGSIVLQLLTGKNWPRTTIEIATATGDCLDHLDGEWPLDLATELHSIARRCLSENGAQEESITAMPITEINHVKRKADQLVAGGELSPPLPVEEANDVEDLSNVPRAFLCPIYQDVMRNPHLAADGFSYEMEAIEKWLKTGHDTSPMTNLRLKHKLLTPNHTLRSLIQYWQSRRSTAPHEVDSVQFGLN